MVLWRDQGFVRDSDDDDEFTQPAVSNTELVHVADEANTQSLDNNANIAYNVKNASKNLGWQDVSSNTGDIQTSPISKKVRRSREYFAAQETLNDKEEAIDDGRTLGGLDRHSRDRLDQTESEDELSLPPPAWNEQGAETASSQPPSSNSTRKFQPSSSHASLLSSKTSPVSVSTKPVVLVETPLDQGPLLLDEQLTEPLVYGRTRKFRQRNPIQIHPYLLEQEQYRQSFRARGLRPVALGGGNDSQPPHHGAAEQLSQQLRDHSPSSSFHSDADQSVGSSPRVNLSPSVTNLPNQEADLQSSDAETPFSRSGIERYSNGNKRRKIRHLDHPANVDVVTSLRGPATRQVPQSDHDRNAKFFTDSSDSDVEQHPESFSKNAPQKTKFRFPRGFKPSKVALPSPDPSSHDRSLGHDLEISMPGFNRAPASPESEDGEDMIDSTDTPEAVVTLASSSSESDTVRRTQKRIKGVLPASWLTLDKHLQVKATRPNSAGKSTATLPTEQLRQRGVAQRVTKPAGQRSNWDIVELSDGSEKLLTPSPLPSKPTTFTAHRSLVPTAPSSFQRSFEEAKEDNMIDTMAPPALRHYKKPSRPRKRQTRLPEMFEKEQHPDVTSTRLDRTINDNHSAIPVERKRSNIRRERAAKQQSRRLSILDFVGKSPEMQPPDFLRVAIRIVRNRSDRGRQSPHRKLLSFNNRSDDADAGSVLEDWKSGRISTTTNRGQTYKRNQESRTPLAETTHNVLLQQQQQDSTIYSERAQHPSVRVNKHRARSGSRADKNSSKQSHLIEASLSGGTLTSLTTQHQQQYSQKKQNQQQHPQSYAQKVQSSRSGQLETLQKPGDLRNRKEIFKHHIFQAGNQSVTQHNEAKDSILARFLQTEESSLGRDLSDQEQDQQLQQRRPLGKRHINSRRKKQCVNRVRTEDPVHFRRPHEVRTEDDIPYRHATDVLQHTSCVVTGLNPLGAQYSVDFNFPKLPPGTYFHQSSFVGSGTLQAVLSFHEADLDSPRGSVKILCNNETFSWGPWNEDVASQFAKLFDRIATTQMNPEQGLIHLNDVIGYINTTLNFTDTVGRSSCVSWIIESSQKLHQRLVLTKDLQVRFLMYLLVLASHAAQICTHPTVASAKLDQAEQMLVQFAESLLTELQSYEETAVSDFIMRLGLPRVKEAGIRDSDAAVQAVVVLSHILNSSTMRSRPGSFWDLFNKQQSSTIDEHTNDVQALEGIWKCFFSFLPLLEFDTQGIHVGNAEDEANTSNWVLVKSLFLHTCRLQDKLPESKTSTINSYIRVNLGRCFHLLQFWGWDRCETMLSTFFDFFARHNLSLLKEEQSKTSPAFLENLDTENLDVSLNASDRSFHIYLKFLFTGLRKMSLTYSEKRMRNIAWRFVPNHGRSNRKDEELQQNHLDALRNHHDLLTVLYTAVPCNARPQLNLIRQLADFQTSHIEICLLSIRTWTNLVRFQLSTDEPLTALEPFGQWFRYMIEGLISQHRSARIEAEEFAQSAVVGGMPRVSKNVLESTIRKNEKQVEAILHTTIASLVTVVQNSKNTQAGLSLFRCTHLKTLFGLFDPQHDRLNTVLGEAVDAYRSVLEISSREYYTTTQRQSNEDSQEYGEWPLTDSFDEVDVLLPDRTSNDELIEPIAQLLSNCFGSEHCFDETLLKKVVDAWVTVSLYAVQNKLHDWVYYLDHQSPGSWWQLRDTIQTRKYFPYYLSSVLDVAKESFHDNRWTFLTAWLNSLVERESMLKFQNLLTMKLLQYSHCESLLYNLPFATIDRAAIASINLHDLRERRLSLISTVLHNLRRAHDATYFFASPNTIQLRQEYKQLVRQLMDSMRKNFQQIDVSSSTQGSYVEFVQAVVEILQQYTSEIYPIDKFFTDSTAFPLPARDPMYVVGRLKSYELAVGDEASQKKLAMFVQTVSERAAKDNNQAYLSEQLQKSTEKASSHKESSTCSLLRLLMEGIFPAYIDVTFAMPTGWLFSLPILETLMYDFDRLLLSLNFSDSIMVSKVIQGTSVALGSLQSAMACVSSSTSLLKSAPVLMTIGKMILAVASVLKPFDFLFRSAQPVEEAMQNIMWVHDFVLALESHLCDQDGVTQISFPGLISTSSPTSELAGLRSFCVRQLTETLNRNWHEENGELLVKWGGSKKHVVMDVGLWEEERGTLLIAIHAFKDILSGLPSFTESVDYADSGFAQDIFI